MTTEDPLARLAAVFTTHGRGDRVPMLREALSPFVGEERHQLVDASLLDRKARLAYADVFTRATGHKVDGVHVVSRFEYETHAPTRTTLQGMQLVDSDNTPFPIHDLDPKASKAINKALKDAEEPFMRRLVHDPDREDLGVPLGLYEIAFTFLTALFVDDNVAAWRELMRLQQVALTIGLTPDKQVLVVMAA